jgi:hypothetical protein
MTALGKKWHNQQNALALYERTSASYSSSNLCHSIGFEINPMATVSPS